MTEILFPVSRMIGGNLEKTFQATDSDNQPKTKNGEPIMRCNFGVAIPKGPETHWNQTEWGAKIYNAAVTDFPNGEYNAPTFAWKITDGDSQIPNKRGNKPCDQTGYPGNWVMWFSQGWLPKKVNADGTQELTDPAAIVPGYFVQVLGEAVGNKSTQSPGVYLNPKAVALSGYGEPIKSKETVDTTSVGFGGQPLPAGASATPLPGMTAPPDPQVSVPPPAQGAPVTPAHDFVTPGAAGEPPVPPIPAAPVGPVMTAKAAGASYDSFIAKGWTDETLKSNGYME